MISAVCMYVCLSISFLPRNENYDNMQILDAYFRQTEIRLALFPTVGKEPVAKLPTHHIYKYIIIIFTNSKRPSSF